MVRNHAYRLCISVMLFTLIAGAAMAEDRVTVRDIQGRATQYVCTILEETYNNIRIEYQDEEIEIPLVKDGDRYVIEVRRRRFPSIFTRANTERQSRNFEAAFDLFRESAEAGEINDSAWLLPYLRYYSGDVAYMEAEYGSWEPERKNEWFSAAAARFERLLEESPRHRFIPDAALALARALTKMGEFERAREVYASIENSDYPFWIRDEALVWRARLRSEEGDHAGAIEDLSALWERYEDRNPLLAYRARVFEGLARQAGGDFERAESLFQEAGLHAPDSEMQAAAWNYRGLSLLSRGNQREALMSFLRVALMHPDVRNQTQMALFYAARASEEYYGNDDRAGDLRNKLRMRFPGSYWANRLEE